jgi:hypothetical protein
VATFFSGLGDSSGVGVAVGLGEAVGVGVGEDFLRFTLGVSSPSGVGEGVGELLRFCFLVDFGEALGDADGVGLLFLVERLCRRGLGVGVGVAKNFLTFSPNDGSSART